MVRNATVFWCVCLSGFQHVIFVLFVFLTLVSSVAFAGINKTCLNSDAAAQSRLYTYEDETLDLTAENNSFATSVANELPRSTPKAARNDQTAISPFELSKKRLLDWDSWPVLSVTLSNKTYRFLGVHVTDKNVSKVYHPCIRLMFRIFAPIYREVAGFGMLRSEYEKGSPKQIKLRDAVSSTSLVTCNSTEQFFVIDLDRLRASTYWQRRYETYRSNVNSARDPKAYPVHFERFLFDVIRLSRYGPQRMPQEDRQNFIDATVRALEGRNISCTQERENPVCILNQIFMETELGAADPLKVSDALDNSGLAFGPRQLDLGQKRLDATMFALKYLIDDNRKVEKWQNRFLRPIEQLPRRDLSALYKDVIPEFNEKLSLFGNEVVNLYIDGLMDMTKEDYKLRGIQFIGKAQLLVRLIAADFSNKWGIGNARRIGAALSRKIVYDECGIVGAWAEQVKRRFLPGDIEDYKRRSTHIIRYFSNATNIPLKLCNK